MAHRGLVPQGKGAQKDFMHLVAVQNVVGALA
jgi:hypothetical protein